MCTVPTLVWFFWAGLNSDHLPIRGLNWSDFSPFSLNSMTKESTLYYPYGPLYVWSRKISSSAMQDVVCYYGHKLTNQPTDGQTNQVDLRWHQAYHLFNIKCIKFHKAFLSNYWTLIMWSAINTIYKINFTVHKSMLCMHKFPISSLSVHSSKSYV